MTRLRTKPEPGAQADLSSATWTHDHQAIAKALSRGASPNAKDSDGYPLWAHLLRPHRDPQNVARCLEIMLQNGLSLVGGGSTKNNESMFMRIESLDPIVAHTLINHVGPANILSRLATQRSQESLDIRWWSDRMIEAAVMLDHAKIEEATPPAPALARKGPRL